MIDQVLGFIGKSLDQTLKPKLRWPHTDQLVRLSPLVTLGGDPPDDIENKVILTVINVQMKAAIAQRVPYRPVRDDGDIEYKPAANFVLFLLVSATFESYQDSFRVLSAILSYFHKNDHITAQTAPEFPPGVNTLTVELVDLDLNELNNLWNMLGCKHRPSLVYKIRFVVRPDELAAEEVPGIVGSDVEP